MAIILHLRYQCAANHGAETMRMLLPHSNVCGSVTGRAATHPARTGAGGRVRDGASSDPLRTAADNSGCNERARRETDAKPTVRCAVPEIRQSHARLSHTLEKRTWHPACLFTAIELRTMEGHMSHAITLRGVVGLFEHALTVLVGFVLMVIGLALGVTMIMLPVGIVIGLIGFAMFVGGLFVRLDQR
jgi:hypothetical protein